MKNNQSSKVRNRTSGAKRPERRDRRVERTRTSLHDALIGLAREKPYGAIAVKEILSRANVGKSTFYTHFRGKDELLESGIHDMLRSIHDEPRSTSATENVLAFSRPILEYVGRHRRTGGPRMTREGRIAMHEHLQQVLVEVISEDVASAMRSSQASPQVPAALLARHIIATFVLLLNWWVDTESPLTPMEVDARFRTLVLPILTTA